MAPPLFDLDAPSHFFPYQDHFLLATKVAIGLMGAWGGIAIVSCLYYMRTHRKTPAQGSQHEPGRTRTAVGPLLLLLIPLVLMLVAMSMDTWARTSGGAPVHFGLLSVRSESGRHITRRLWKDECASVRSGSGDSSACTTIQASGLLVLIAASLSLLCTFICVCLSLLSLCSQAALSRSILRIWRFSGVAHVCCLSAYIWWVAGSWLVLSDVFSGLQLGVSWWLFLAAMVMSQVSTSWVAKTVRGVPRPSDEFTQPIAQGRYMYHPASSGQAQPPVVATQPYAGHSYYPGRQQPQQQAAYGAYPQLLAAQQAIARPVQSAMCAPPVQPTAYPYQQSPAAAQPAYNPYVTNQVHVAQEGYQQAEGYTYQQF